MSPEQRRAIARKGARAVHQQGTGHVFTPEEARATGQKGGKRLSQDRDHMAAIGCTGGLRAARNARIRAWADVREEEEFP